MSIDKIGIGKRIKNIRLSMKDTKTSMAEFGNMLSPTADRSLVARWEHGVNLPNDQRLKQIAKLGGVTTDYLLFGKQLIGIGERIQSLRALNGLSRNDLSRLFRPHIEESLIKNWEEEVSLPTLEQIKMLADKLHVHYIYLITGERRKHESDAYHISPYRFLDEVEDELDKHNFTDEERIQLDRDSKIYLESRLLSVRNPDMYHYVTHLLKQLEFISHGNFEKEEEYDKIIKTIDFIFKSLDKK